MAAPDYRISKVGVLCKDCGQDVGPYPTRHRCGASDAPSLSSTSRDSVNSSGYSLAPPSLAPPRPGLPGRSNTGGRYGGRTAPSSASSSGNTTAAGGSSLRAGAGRWNRLAGQSAPSSNQQVHGSGSGTEDEGPNSGNNTSLWGKFRAATAWNNDASDASGSERGDEETGEAGPPQSTSSGKKLWGKIMGSGDNEKSEEPDSDTSDYEGESHVTRLLKSYYRERYPEAQLPGWLTHPPPDLYRPFGGMGRERPVSSSSSFSPQHTQVPIGFGHEHRRSQDNTNTNTSSNSRNSVGSASNMYGQSSLSPTNQSYESPALVDSAKYARGSSGTLPPAPSRRPTRQRVNVRRDAGAFFNDDN
ncbi:hypothetical protein BDF19DRAFT_415803 [Syncephalis fuscata]|nr:hypothetical protein BDF19DRAFT_415803 [Syncephalis fuscata]